MREEQSIYKPIQFIAITFTITWACAFFMAYQTWLSYNTVLGMILLSIVDFLESASPLIAALILLRKSLFSERKFFQFLLGDRPQIIPYSIVTSIFVFQFLTFYLFAQSNVSISISVFLSAWGGQILFGGGMEEGGWRGYLQPAFEKKFI